MQIGQSITTSTNGIPITAQIRNISAAFVSADIIEPPAEIVSADISWKLEDYETAVANGQIIELPMTEATAETPEV